MKVCNRLPLVLNVSVSLHNKNTEKVWTTLEDMLKRTSKSGVDQTLNILAIDHGKDTSVTFQDVT